jgi:hypothetical protein
MKKNLSALSITLTLLLSILSCTFTVKLAEANPHLPPAPVLSIESPTRTVNAQDVAITVYAKVPAYGTVYGFEGIKWLNYSLDSGADVPVELEFQEEINRGTNDTTNPFNGDAYYLYAARHTLTSLPDGAHYLVVKGESVFGVSLQLDFSFTVDTIQPVITIHSPSTVGTYNSTNVALNYFASENTSWTAYNLGGKDNVTITGNTTLTGLASGVHTLTVYANDTAGNMAASDTITFQIYSKPNPETLLIPTLTAATIVTAGILSISLLIYCKKQKR